MFSMFDAAKHCNRTSVKYHEYDLEMVKALCRKDHSKQNALPSCMYQ
jgi:hypothetical protein